MHLRRYRTGTVAEALALAREELGPNALVLSTRMVRTSGLNGWLGAREVEVTVAAERPEVSEKRPRRLESRQAAPQPSSEDAIVARLRAGGLQEALAREVARNIPRRDRRGTSVAGLRRALAEQLTGVAAVERPVASVELFVGPPGAGKTTTIAKIAAQERVKSGRRMSVVSADAFRVGAMDQLRTYADIIGAPFFAARSSSDLEAALSAATSPVLIDTAGRSPNDASSFEMLGGVARRSDVRTHLVLPAATTPREAERILDRYRDFPPDCLALTRVDEADAVSPLVGFLWQRGIPVSYLGTGQRVPEDLYRATPPLLASCALGEMMAESGDAR